MSKTIKGIEKKRGWYYYRPSKAGLKVRPKAIALKTKNLDEAIQKIIDLRGVNFQSSARSISEWFEIYIQARRDAKTYQPKQIDEVERMVPNFFNIVGRHADPSGVNESHVSEWWVELTKSDRQPVSNLKFLRYGSAFFTWLMDSQKVIKDNPFRKVMRGSKIDKSMNVVATKVFEFWTVKERNKILKTLKRYRTDRKENLTFILLMGFYTGMRIREILNCKWKWFHFKKVKGKTLGSVSIMNEPGIFTTKSGKTRRIPMPDVLVDFVQNMKRGNPDDYVLHSEIGAGTEKVSGRRYCPRSLYEKFIKHCGYTVKGNGFHKMRHTYAHSRIEAGTTEAKIVEWLGFSWQIYNKHYKGVSEFDEEANLI